jgi:uncharacterized protein
VTIPHGAEQLEVAGNLSNLRAAAEGDGSYRARTDDAGLTFPFLDSDVYKWLEAAGWALGQERDDQLAATADAIIEIVGAAQRGDGYLNSYFQVVTPGRRYHDPEWGHELYTAGHLVQAAIAWTRALNDDRLLAIASRAVETIHAELGVGRRELIDGHPQIEMALVELYRTTGDARHLELASALLDRRGRGLLRPDRFGAEYWQDHAPVRAAPLPIGHAVRQTYLDCGAVDVAVETDDQELLAVVLARWEAMVASRTYLTGGLGARQRDEAFGEAYELPPDVAYAETCAAIGSVMLAWRLLLATGEPRFADLIERTSLNAVLSGLGLDGTHFFYANPLHVRDASQEGSGPIATRRQPWFACACCPPNLMRFLATYPDLIATTSDDGISLHQFAPGTIKADGSSGRIGLRVETSYPWSGAVAITVVEAPSAPWELRVRVPAWCRGGSATLEGRTSSITEGAAELSFMLPPRAGVTLIVAFDMPARVTTADPRVDAVRASVAIERGPLVYAVEEADLPPGTTLESLEIERSVAPEPAEPDPALPGIKLLETQVAAHAAPVARAWPYGDAAEMRVIKSAPVTVRAVPYFAWGNRGPGGMRVWLPARD